MPAFDYSQLDAGIRQTVARLHGWGFPTCDSGDGTKPEGEPVPHVYIRLNAPGDGVNPTHAFLEAARLRACLDHHGLAGLGIVELRWSPNDGIALIALHGIGDHDWPTAYRGRP